TCEVVRQVSAALGSWRVHGMREFQIVFFFQAEDGIRDRNVTGVQTCALPILLDEACRVAVLAHTMLGCRDYSRADFRLSEANELYFLEHNFNPGIGPNTQGLSNTFTRMRSEERRVGKERRARMSRYQ